MARGELISTPRRRARQILVIGALWLASLVALVGWWTNVVMTQAERIVQLEIAHGVPASVAEASWRRTRRMLSGESTAFWLLIVGATSVLAWFYWRDTLRTRSLNAFFASVTHELRTPLTSLRLQAELLSERAASGPDVEQRQQLLADLTRLENQVERMLELARLEGGGEILDEYVPLGPALVRVRERAHESHSDRVEVTITTATPDAVVLGDHIAIDMILRNLVDNALRHGGRRTVHVGMEVSQTANAVTLRCRDDGIGCAAPGTLGRLFVRGSDSRGAGVGLYLIDALMKQMGGSVRYQSRVGAGFVAALQFRRGQVVDSAQAGAARDA